MKIAIVGCDPILNASKEIVHLLNSEKSFSIIAADIPLTSSFTDENNIQGDDRDRGIIIKNHQHNNPFIEPNPIIISENTYHQTLPKIRTNHKKPYKYHR